MPPTEETQYTIICNERFNKIDVRFDKTDEKLEDIHKVIVGNGQNGLAGRLIRVEEQVTVQKRRWGYILGVLAVVLAAGIIAVGGVILRGLQ